MTQQILSFPESNPTSNRFDGTRAAGLNADEQETIMALALSILARKHRRGSALTARTILAVAQSDHGGYAFESSAR